MLRRLLDLVFPVRSLTGEPGAWVTQDELTSLRSQPILLDAEACARHGMPSIRRLVAAGSYDRLPLLRKAIWTFKYRRMPGCAGPLGTLLLDAVPLLHLADAVLCPVPLHWTRTFWRGFNQAELLAEVVAQKSGQLPVSNLLRRTRPTGHQARRGRSERLTALHGAFRYADPGPPPARVILVDDICTSGATLESCAAALKAAGVQKIDALVLAMG